MRSNNYTENQIINLLARLPKKAVIYDGKERAWHSVQNHIRATRALPSRETVSWIRELIGIRYLQPALTALVAIISVGLTLGVTSAAKSSLPGETLYPVKKYVVEKFEIALAISPEKKVEILSNHAKSRLYEITTLIENKGTDQGSISDTIQALKITTAEVKKVAEKESTDKPELLGQAVKLAIEEEKTLSELEQKTEGIVKEAVKEAASGAKTSLEQLREGTEQAKEEVKGQTQGTSQAETDTDLSKPIESNIQIDQIFKDNNNDSSNTENSSGDEPELEIITTPPTGF